MHRGVEGHSLCHCRERRKGIVWILVRCPIGFCHDRRSDMRVKGGDERTESGRRVRSRWGDSSEAAKIGRGNCMATVYGLDCVST